MAETGVHGYSLMECHTFTREASVMDLAFRSGQRASMKVEEQLLGSLLSHDELF